MSQIVAFTSLSLDGVMQAPGRPDEDVRGGFVHGGWATTYRDPILGQVVAEGMSQAGPLLFGRRTYQDFHAVWPGRTGNPFSKVLDDARKLVASRTLVEPLPWNNSELLPGDAADAVARLRAQPGPDILVMGSGELLSCLRRRGLVDRYVLLIHPLLLGSGRRLFPDDGPVARLRLVSSRTTGTGVVIAVYETEGSQEKER